MTAAPAREFAPRNIDSTEARGNSIDGGGGFKVRLGEQIRVPGIRITPELG